MFYACVTVLVLLAVMCFCVTIAVIDLETYNFGLYIVLLCIVGTMLACALCIANPNACANPKWYSNFCLMLQEMYPISPPDGASSSKMNGLHSRIMALQSQQAAAAAAAAPSATAPSTDGADGKLPLRQESRATVAMLAPAVHIMHQVWKGMAWVADGIDNDDDEDEDEATKSADITEQGLSMSTSDSHSDTHAFKRLSTIAESSCSVVHECEPDEISSEYTSSHDVIV